METDIRQDGSRSEFRETVLILWRRKLIVVGTAVVVTLLSVLMSARGTPRYEASSMIVIRPLIPPAAFQSGSGYGGPLGLDASTKDERQIAKSATVVDRLRESLKLPEDAEVDVTVEIVSEHTMRFIATAETAEMAAKLANQHARSYIVYRQETTERALRDIIERTKGRIDALIDELAKLDGKVLQLSEQVGALSAVQRPSQTVQGRRASLAAQIVQLNSIRTEKLFQLTDVRTRYDDAQASAGRASGGGEIVEFAEPPVAAASPKPFRAGMIGLILGLGLGVALAFLRNHFDSRIRSVDEASQAMGVQVLGEIARSPRWRRRKEAYLDSVADPASRTAEGYRTLRQTLIRAGIGSELKTILVTSGGRRAGKSALAANLGVQFARAGMRTVVVSADLRTPRVHEFFGIENHAGFSEFVRGETSTWTLPQTKVPNLWLLPSGSGSNPSQLLDGPEMRPLMQRLAEAADVIIIDAPPLCAGADAAILAPYADVTLLTMRHGKARTDGTIAAVRELSQVGASRIGAVMTVTETKRRSFRSEGTAVTAVALRPVVRDETPVVAIATSVHAGNGNKVAVMEAVAVNGNGSRPKRARAPRSNGKATVVAHEPTTEMERE